MDDTHRQAPYLEVTFRHGRPLAGYLYLRQAADRSSHTTRRLDGGLVVDLDRNGVPLGIEITAPEALTLEALNHALRAYGLPVLSGEDLGPLLAA
jgi:uncharacterized protein YuzE